MARDSFSPLFFTGMSSYGKHCEGSLVRFFASCAWAAASAGTMAARCRRVIFMGSAYLSAVRAQVRAAILVEGHVGQVGCAHRAGSHFHGRVRFLAALHA